MSLLERFTKETGCVPGEATQEDAMRWAEEQLKRARLNEKALVEMAAENQRLKFKIGRLS